MQYSDLIGRIVSDTWIVFVVIWALSATTAKKTAKRFDAFWTVRIVAMIVIFIIIRYTSLFVPLMQWYIHAPVVRWIGAGLVVLGICLAFWARFYLGRNWGQPMTEKVGAELVTTGPYTHIRHPIYAGVLLGVMGSILVYGLLWLIVLVVYASYFIYSTSVEDDIMARLFPDQYPAYKARTKKIIPGVW